MIEDIRRRLIQNEENITFLTAEINKLMKMVDDDQRAWLYEEIDELKRDLNELIYEHKKLKEELDNFEE